MGKHNKYLKVLFWSNYVYDKRVPCQFHSIKQMIIFSLFTSISFHCTCSTTFVWSDCNYFIKMKPKYFNKKSKDLCTKFENSQKIEGQGGYGGAKESLICIRRLEYSF